MNISKTHIETPLGEMIACATNKGICLLEFNNRKNIEGQFQKTEKELNSIIVEEDNIHFDLLKKELAAYFRRELNQFTVPLDLIGTEFQKKVWQALLTIPYGKTVSYLQQSEAMGNPLSIRAVANANGMNKIAIIVPCHRVIGSNGKLTGYAGGLEKKRWLLNMEKGITENTLF